MTIRDLFSKRQKRLRGDIPDVYSYDDLPKPLRVQIIYIWNDTLGGNEQAQNSENVDSAYEFIVNSLCREYGLFKLPGAKYGSREYISELHAFFLQEENIEKALDSVELSFSVIDRFARKQNYLHRRDANKRADDAIVELNDRFKEHGVGYQFVEGQIVRVDSELIHSEVVKPALRLLNGREFKGTQQEFLSAYEHYRHGRYKEALNDCLKSFESTMKTICDKKGWSYEPNATAKTLVKACFDNGLIPPFWQQQLNSLRSLLESGIPTGRNKLGAHGQGAQPTAVPEYLVAYMLHMTASTLVFLTKAEEGLE